MLALFLRDIRLGIRTGGGALTGVIFFLAVIATIPFGVGPDLKLLARIGPAVLWISALLACLLGLDRLFQADREDGSLDLLVLGNDRHILALTVLTKCLAHWVGSVLPSISSRLARCCLSWAAWLKSLIMGWPSSAKRLLAGLRSR